LARDLLRCVEKEFDVDNDSQVDLRRTSYLHASRPVLICATRFRGGAPRTVTSTVFYEGVKVYLEAATIDHPPSFSTRSFLAGDGSVGMYGEADSTAPYVVLSDPAGRPVAVFRRKTDGTLEPTGKAEFQRIARSYQAAQAAAEEIDSNRK
jgi:hypothetical protein